MEQDKVNAYMTLYTALTTIAKAAAPMIPFMTESIYQNLVRSVDQDAPKSIHLCDFPEVDESMIDEELEQKMDEVLQIVTLGRACRNAANIKNRQPIGRMLVKAERELPDDFAQIILDELNVKNIEFVDDAGQYIGYEFKPQMRILGPKYGKLLGAIRKALSEQDRGVTVVLDTNLTDELLEEGFVREIISKVQTMRKEADFEVTDHIRVTYDGSDKVKEVMDANRALIAGEVLADALEQGEARGYTKEWKINGEEAVFGVEKI